MGAKMLENKLKGYREAKAMMRFLGDKSMHGKKCIDALKRDLDNNNLTVKKFRIKMRTVLDSWINRFEEDFFEEDDDPDSKQMMMVFKTDGD